MIGLLLKIILSRKENIPKRIRNDCRILIMKPSNYKPGEKYPLLLEIHGGPSAMWGPGEESMWHEYQYFVVKDTE
jgi:dipeptidyl aminopeptidase/acylaminoacyl peptidase